MLKKDIYIVKMQLHLDSLNMAVLDIEDRASVVTDETRVKYKEEVLKLRKQSRLALCKLNELKRARDSSWRNTAAELEKIRDSFTKSIHCFKTTA